MASEKLRVNVETHYHDPATRGEWAMSVAAIAGLDHIEIVRRVWAIKQRVYRMALAGDLMNAGYPVIADGPKHALVMLPPEPDEPVWSDLRRVFADTHPNPFAAERRQHGRR